MIRGTFANIRCASAGPHDGVMDGASPQEIETIYDASVDREGRRPAVIIAGMSTDRDRRALAAKGTLLLASRR